MMTAASEASLKRLIRNRLAVSIVISTLIISAAILVVTGIASFLGMNMLELQNQQAEFDQGRTNMQTLSEIIEDIGVKPGSGSFIRFNERTGGLGYAVQEEPITLTVANGTRQDQIVLTDSPLDITYRGGRLVGTYNSTIKGSDNLIISGLASPLGHLSQQQANGAWLNLDYNRVRIVEETIINVGDDQYYLVTVTFFNITHGEFRGTGNLDVKVQNTGINPPIQLNYYNTDPVTITVTYGSDTQTSTPIAQPSGTSGIIVLVTISNIQVSTL